YGFPFYGLCVLALLCLVSIAPQDVRRFAYIILSFWGAVVVGAMVYTQVAIHRILREPAPAAAALLRTLWDRQYSCGPAYVIGDRNSAHGVAIYFAGQPRGVEFDETGMPFRFDHLEVFRRGAIIVTTPELAAWSAWLRDNPVATLSLPYRRTLRSDEHSYV